MTSSVAVFEAAIGVQSMYMKQSVIENQKKRKQGKMKLALLNQTKLRLKDGLGMDKSSLTDGLNTN